MKREDAREAAVRLTYELAFAERPIDIDKFLQERLSKEAFKELSKEDKLYREAPNKREFSYIAQIIRGINGHDAELDDYIARYSKGWQFQRISLIAAAIMRVSMYELLYMPEVPYRASINSALEIAKKYETPQTVRFINGILGEFVRKEVKPAE